MSSRLFFEDDLSEETRTLIIYCVMVLAGLSIAIVLYNEQIFSLLNGFNSHFSDAFWLAWTTVGDGYILGVFLGCFVAYRPRITALGLAALLVATFLVQGLKFLFPIARPVELVHTVHIVGPVLRYGTFPSGHAAAGMAVALTLYSFCSSPCMRKLILTAAFLIGLSRIFVGAHFPLDVVAGMLTATLSFAICTYLVWPYVKKHVWQTPAWDDAFFRAFYYVELLAASAALLIYSPFFAESGIAGACVSSLIIIATVRRFTSV